MTRPTNSYLGEPPVWSARDVDNAACVIERTPTPGRWQFSVTDGPFSGYPTVDLTLTDLIKLRDALNEEIVR